MSSVACLIVESDLRRALSIVESLKSSAFLDAGALQVATLREAHSLLDRKAFDVIVSKGVFPSSNHSEVLERYRTVGNDPVVLCLLEDEERSVILEAGKLGADDYLFYRDLSDRSLGEAIQKACERRKLIADLKLMQTSPSEEIKGVYRSLLHRLDLALFVVARADGRLLFRNKVAEAWFSENLQATVEQFLDYGVLESDSIELEVPTMCPAVPDAELRSNYLLWQGQECVLVTLRNISKRKRAEAAYRSCQRRLDLALKASNIGLWSWDLATDRIHFNEIGKSQLGYDGIDFPDTLSLYRESVHAEDFAAFESITEMARAGRACDKELRYRVRGKDGRFRRFLCRTELVADERGAFSSLLCTHVDVSVSEAGLASKRLDSALGDKLCVRMERVVADLEKRAAQIRSNFRGDSAIAASIQELERLARSFSCLNEVVQLCESNPGDEPEAIELGSAVNELYRSQESLLPSKVELQVEAIREIPIHGLSKRSLRYVLTEALICVAEKVTSDYKSCIHVCVDLVENSESGLKTPCICFRYTGAPVGEVEMHAFSHSPQVKVSSEQLDLESRLFVRIGGQQSMHARKKLVPKLALLAEDESVLRLAIRTMLESLGFQVVVACDGAEAVEAFAQRDKEYDLALIDLQMPQIDGHGVVSSIRAVRSDLPIVCMSGEESDKLDSSSEGFGDPELFLSKPFGISDLRTAIAELKLLERV